MSSLPGSAGLNPTHGAEAARLQEDATRSKNWKRWGPYLSERQWATVREDYSATGECWDYFPHDQARSRAYRWGEDGLLGITDRECRLCFALALWNGNDPILKERLFGLTANEGNHGEDVKEEYFYLDSSPTHSYMKALYKYPQRAFPYEWLIQENRRRNRQQPEFELLDTGIFDQSRYFDVFVEYAKNGPDDVFIRISVANRGPEPAALHLLPTIWFRNTWIWGCTHEGCTLPPRISQKPGNCLALEHESLGRFWFEIGPDPKGGRPEVLFTNNESNFARLYGGRNATPYVKDAFHEYVVNRRKNAVNPRGFGTKAAPYYVLNLNPGETQVVKLRLHADGLVGGLNESPEFDGVFEQRLRETDEFYQQASRARLNPAEQTVFRQGYAGLLWTKQFYQYIVLDWLKGDPHFPPPPGARWEGRNADWKHVYSRDIISMPDNWEYPWFAVWDLAFHMIPFARIDGEFAKGQLELMLREWYMHPNGQIPAFEFAFSDVNPPVHAWAAWRVYKISGRRDHRDRDFLESVFQKLLLNFTWWVNRKDPLGKNLFAGGFLGLDNIGVFDRSQPLPDGGTLRQADGTAWMAFYALTMMAIALELAREGDRLRPAYEDMASKFLEHFVQIADAMNTLGGTGLWDEQDGFYYDQVMTDHHVSVLRTRSLVGFIPLLAVEVLEDANIQKLPGFYKRLRWFQEHRKDLGKQISHCERGVGAGHGKLLLAIPSFDRLKRMLRYLFDENEFLSPHGVRSLSKYHQAHPFVLNAGGVNHQVDYEPGDSTTGLFGGNSNWRGPVWFPLNFLLIEALERYHHFFGDALQVEFPTGSGKMMNLNEAARELEKRLAGLFLPDGEKVPPAMQAYARFARDPHWRNLLLFHEFFHGDTGQGLGANHQTGWTALAVSLVDDAARRRAPAQKPATAKDPSNLPEKPRAVTIK